MLLKGVGEGELNKTTPPWGTKPLKALFSINCSTTNAGLLLATLLTIYSVVDSEYSE